jgi:tryptophanyl-tRNA synthetase
MKTSLTGIRATGEIHLGNYLGAMQPALRSQDTHQCIYFIADLHALTSNRDPQYLRDKTYDVLATWLALGFDHKRHIIFRQSDVPLVTELSWYLGVCTGMGFLEKGHAYKDALAQSKEVNFGVFAYPVLMAADILLYDADEVPVGKDQKQHVEMARDMAGALNAIYGAEVLHMPEPKIQEDVMLIPGLDGRKMSKSYDNTIPLFAPTDVLRKKVLSLKTDSTPLEAPKSMEGITLGHLFKHFSTPAEYADLEQRLQKGGLGWGHAKAELAEAIDARVAEPRRIYLELQNDKKRLDEIALEGANKAYARASKVLDRVRHAIGLQPYPYRPR